MLEVQGLMRSEAVRMRLDREVAPGDLLDLRGRRWEVTGVRSARSLHVDRRIVAREIVEPVAPAA
jgi:hypothetical protein